MHTCIICIFMYISTVQVMRMISDIHTHTQFPPLLVLALQKPAIKKLSHIYTQKVCWTVVKE